MSAPGVAGPLDPFAFPANTTSPFFTRQTNLTTHHAQLTKWSSLVLAFCRHHRLHRISLSQSQSQPPSSSSLSTTTTATTTTGSAQPAPEAILFHNPAINRRLSLADIREVLEFMRKGRADPYVSASGSGAGSSSGAAAAGDATRDVWWVFWRTPEEWAALVEKWVDDTAQRGTVLTVYELTEGEACRGTEFYGLDRELMIKALQILVKRNKAQIFGQEDSQGVKFFA
ncbi:unnamed protein product [Parascedosporium putredinis]|uniref:ESCRT-II complex subunit VPS25 n=1 Tax=Parascedosporium putredinis TaxID=1442378 RepID=A0A9P1ME08_9PEZI|nr:unnamed protein product [Parascedosporium putredinis]CAI8004731.1 unnamed protein product [Parascedosporium putredinis]